MNDTTPYINALRVIRDTLRNAEYVTNPDIANDLVDEAMMIVDLVLMDDSECNKQDSHLICPSYPNCDESPLGCRILMGNDVEYYGAKD